MYHCGFATCHWTKVVSLVLCFIMTFGTVEYTTRRRRKTDVETDEAQKCRMCLWCCLGSVMGFGMRRCKMNYCKVYIYILYIYTHFILYILYMYVYLSSFIYWKQNLDGSLRSCLEETSFADNFSTLRMGIEQKKGSVGPIGSGDGWTPSWSRFPTWAVHRRRCSRWRCGGSGRIEILDMRYHE